MGILPRWLLQIQDMQEKMYALNIKPIKEVVDLTEEFQKTRVALCDVLLAQTPSRSFIGVLS